jgi:uncharacterized protein (TIGR02145 family)
MSRYLKILIIGFLSICFVAFLQSCKRKPGIPVLTTENVSGITQTSAVSGGNISNDGGAEVSARGVCWGFDRNPTTGSNKTSDGKGSGAFTSIITGLTANTDYYVRAYATNSEGTSYGNEVAFKSSQEVNLILPTLTTVYVNSVTLTTAASGGVISDNGGGTILSCGVCWNTSENPTISNAKTADNLKMGGFNSYLKGLSSNTTYYIRAFASNNAGTAYGNQLSFKTGLSFSSINFNNDLTYGTVTDIDGNIYKTIAIGTQTWMAENLKTTKLNDGTSIQYVTEDSEWATLSTPAYCWYANETDYTKGYGALYNWYTVKTGKICPAGWHVPYNDEWNVLMLFLGGDMAANPKTRETGTTHWQSKNADATNSTGFTALPSGERSKEGQFDGFGYKIVLWTSLEIAPSGAVEILWGYMTDGTFNTTMTGGGLGSYKEGLSIRCVKN